MRPLDIRVIKGIDTPETRLVLALIDDAINTLRKYSSKDNRWLIDYSFLTGCFACDIRLLNIDSGQEEVWNKGESFQTGFGLTIPELISCILKDITEEIWLDFISEVLKDKNMGLPFLSHYDSIPRDGQLEFNF